MFKIQSIILSGALWGYAAAAGCYPSYSSGSAYAVGDWVSMSTTVTSPVTYTACNPPGIGSCPANGFVTTGGVSTTTVSNYQCNSEYWCSNSGFAPGSVYTDLAWTKESTACTGPAASATKAPSNAPTNSPTISSGGGGCPVVWSAGDSNKYKENDRVSVTVTTTPLVKSVYKCKAWPYSGFCGQFSPLHAAGGSLGWDLVGGCTGTITPTRAPTFAPGSVISGCPGDYNPAFTGYKAGDKVSKSVGTYKVVYQCREWPNEGWCNQSGYAPGGQYEAMAWTSVGPCDGTLAPTTAPTAFVGDCKYIKVVTTTTTSTSTVIDTAVWTAGTLYEAGDQVRIGGTTFTCKPWPFYFWCRIAAYAPTLSATGLWTEAWTSSGPCVYVSLPPTAAPTRAPTLAPTNPV